MIALYWILGISGGCGLLYGMYRLGILGILVDILEAIGDALSDIDIDLDL